MECRYYVPLSDLPSPLLHCLTESSASTTSPGLKYKNNCVTTMNKGRLDLCALICFCVNECLWVTYFKTQSLSLCLHTQPRLRARTHTSQLEYREQPTMGNFTRERGVPTRASSYTAERQRGSVKPLPGGRQNIWIKIEHTVLFYIANNNNNKIDHIKQHKNLCHYFV